MEEKFGLTRRSVLGSGVSALSLAAIPAMAQNAPPLRIGFGLALSGGLAALGKIALLTWQIWAEEVNQRGGLLGRKVEFVFYDDQSNPATVPGIYAKLLDIDKVDLVLSGYGTTQIGAAMPTVIQRKKILMALFSLNGNERFKYPGFFQMQPNGSKAKYEFSRGFFQIAKTLDPKPKTLALLGADIEFVKTAFEGAHENAKELGIDIVYERTYPPNTIEFSSIIRTVKAAKPELIYIGSYPPDSAGLVRAAHEVGLSARLFGGGMIGLQSATLKTQLGPLLNGIVSYDLYVPEPTMDFPGLKEMLAKYQARAQSEGLDPLGFYIAPLAYAEIQILEQAIKATNSVDDAKLIDYVHRNSFKTVGGEIKFDSIGEWAEPRALLIQYQGVVGNNIEQFKEAGKQVILYPPKYKSGDVITPFKAGNP
jgi:branched-chain amino acid transport system substrate-binding protein